MATVDKAKRVLLRAVRPCADVEDILLNEITLERGRMRRNELEVNSSDQE